MPLPLSARARLRALAAALIACSRRTLGRRNFAALGFIARGIARCGSRSLVPFTLQPKATDPGKFRADYRPAQDCRAKTRPSSTLRRYLKRVAVALEQPSGSIRTPFTS